MGKPSHTIKTMARRAVTRYREGMASGTDRLATDDYIEAFRASSRRKGQEVLQSLRQHNIDEGKIIYVSIGSAECHEIEYILEHSSISRFLAFDISHLACESAWNRLRPRLPPRQLTLLSGDAISNTAELHGYLRELITSDDDILVISIHSLLHELISEDVFEIEAFLRSLVSRYSHVFLYIREPCAPINLPNKMSFSYLGLDSSELVNFVEIVRDGLKLNGEIIKANEDFVICESRLAIEAIVKLFYIEDFEYEMGEKITAIHPFDFSSILANLSPDGVLDYSFMNSGSFFRNFANNVRIENISGHKIPMPLAFMKVIYFKGLKL